MTMLMKKNHLEKLPTELKIMILQMLSQQDLCNVALVSKNLKSLALDPNLWPELTVNQHVLKKLKKEGTDSLLITCNRFKKIQSLKVKTLSIIQIPPALWTNWFKLFSKVVKLDLSEAKLNRKEAIDIVKNAVQSNSIVELILSNEILTTLPMKLLTKTFTKMNKVNLDDTDFTVEQFKHIFEAITKSKSLIDLNVCGQDLEEVPKQLLSQAISNLKKVDLIRTYLSTEQLVSIFEATIKSNSLIELYLGEIPLKEVPIEILSEAICKLKKVDLSSTRLSTEQLVAVLKATIKSNSLIELDLSENRMKEVPTELISDAVYTLNKVGLCSTGLSMEQFVAIFEATIKSNSPIELNLSRNNLIDVPKELLSKTISRLKKVDLYLASLSTEPLVAIFEASIKSNSLVNLNLSNISLIQGLKEVPKEILYEALCKLKNVDLSGTRLSTEQLVAVLEATIKSNSLIELELRENNFKEVPLELLSVAISKLLKLDLLGSYLQTEQIVVILEATIKSDSLIHLEISIPNQEMAKELICKAKSKLKMIRIFNCFW